MAKRKKRAETTTKKIPKTATPEKPHPTEPSVISVNDMYDQMPDVIEDPAAVFRMAMLEMKRVALNNKLAVVVHEHERRVAAALAEQKRAIEEVKAELREAEKQYIAQKQEIENQYGISLRAYTYNDETGVLTKNELIVEELRKQEQAAEESSSESTETLQ